MEIKNLIYQTGKILYKIVEVPFKAIIGNYSTESQEKIKEIKHLKNQVRSLDSELEEAKLERILKQKHDHFSKMYSNKKLN